MWDLPGSVIKPMSPALGGGSYLLCHWESPRLVFYYSIFQVKHNNNNIYQYLVSFHYTLSMSLMNHSVLGSFMLQILSPRLDVHSWQITSVLSNSLNPLDCGLPDSTVPGILQARMLEWVTPWHHWRHLGTVDTKHLKIWLLVSRKPNIWYFGILG